MVKKSVSFYPWHTLCCRLRANSKHLTSPRILAVCLISPIFGVQGNNWPSGAGISPANIFAEFPGKYGIKVEVTKALSALQPLYGKDNIEIVTISGLRVRGVVRSMKTTQALTKPSVKIERADGEIIKIAFADIIEVIDHNAAAGVAP